MLGQGGNGSWQCAFNAHKVWGINKSLSVVLSIHAARVKVHKGLYVGAVITCRSRVADGVVPIFVKAV